MAFTKDYKGLYEATKKDLNDQVAYSVELQDDIDDLKKELKETKNDLAIRERVAVEVHRMAWDARTADAMMAWIGGVSPVAILKTKRKGKRGPVPGVKRGPYKKTGKVVKAIQKIAKQIPPWEEADGKTLFSMPVKGKKKVGPKRPYAKKSKFWKNPKRAPWGSKKKK